MDRQYPKMSKNIATMLNLVQMRGSNKIIERSFELDCQNALTRLEYSDLDKNLVRPGHESVEADLGKFSKLEVGLQRRIDLPADPI